MYIAIESERMTSYSVIHMTVVFRERMPQEKSNALMGRIIQISGPNAGSFLDAKDILAKFESFPDPNLVKMVWGERKVLLLNIALGRDPKGQRVFLAPQVEAIRTILKGDPDVLLIEANDVWAERLDQLDQFMRRLKRVGFFFIGAGILAFTYFWAIFLKAYETGGHATEKKERDLEESEKDQRKVFWGVSDTKIQNDIPENAIPVSMKSMLVNGSLMGFVVGILSIATIWSGHAFLYPGNLDPILVGKGWLGGDTNRIMLLSLPVITGVMGWLSGVVSRLLPSS